MSRVTSNWMQIHYYENNDMGANDVASHARTHIIYICVSFIPARMNETCVTDKIEELGILPDNLTRSLLVNNMTNCSLGHLYQTPSSEYWQYEIKLYIDHDIIKVLIK